MKDLLYFTITGITIVTMFWIFISKPYNDNLNAALDCMDEIGDFSEEGYNLCSYK